MGILKHIEKSNSTKSLSYFDKATTGKGILDVETVSSSQRPADGFLSMNKDSETVLNDKMYVVRYRDLWNLSRISDIHQLIFTTRARKTFRGGFEIEANFEESSKDQKKDVEKWIRKCNNNGQSLKEVLQELDKDLNWADDFYFLCLKDYGYNSDGKIIQADPKEFLRLHPLSVELVLDQAKRLGRFHGEHNDADGQSRLAFFNPKTRNNITDKDIDPATGKQNLQAHYRVSTEAGYKYYNESEILHKSAFNPSLTYGYSPMFSQYQKTLILMLQDSYIKKYYGDDKPTKGLLVFNTNNKDGLMKTFDQIRTATQKNPHGIKPIIAESADGRKPVEYIDMAKTLNEMSYTATREEIRQQIGAMYGVSTMFMNDMSSGGGLNNEGLQLTITNEVIQDRQDLFNKTALKFMFEENLGFLDWEVTITPDIEQDLMAEQQLEAQELANVETKLRLGLKGSMDKQGDFKFDEGELVLEQPADDSMMPFSLGKSEIKKADFQKAEKVRPLPIDAKELDKKLNQELKDIFKELNITETTKLNKSTLLKAVGKVSKKLEKQLRKAGASVFKGIYEKAAKETNKKLGRENTTSESDKALIETLKEDPKYQEAFTNLSVDNSNRIRDTINTAFSSKDISIDNLVNNLEEDLDATKGQLRNIVRTETGKISAGARKEQLNKTGAEYTYFHIGPNDNRTTQLSKNIENLTKNGVSWEKYLSIMKKESKKFFPEWTVNDDSPLSHYQSRHIFTFKRVGNKQ